MTCHTSNRFNRSVNTSHGVTVTDIYKSEVIHENKNETYKQRVAQVEDMISNAYAYIHSKNKF